MIPDGTQAQLFLNGELAGLVTTRHRDNSWAFGDFTPTAKFKAFAPLFGRWSLLMHADGDTEPMSNAAAEELRETEVAIDLLKAKLFVPERDAWYPLAQVNIDGPMIEWKES